MHTSFKRKVYSQFKSCTLVLQDTTFYLDFFQFLFPPRLFSNIILFFAPSFLCVFTFLFPSKFRSCLFSFQFSHCHVLSCYHFRYAKYFKWVFNKRFNIPRFKRRACVFSVHLSFIVSHQVESTMHSVLYI